MDFNEFDTQDLIEIYTNIDNFLSFLEKEKIDLEK